MKSFLLVLFSSRQNKHAFDNNHLRKERMAMRWSNWLYHIFTIYLPTKRSYVEEMHPYTYIYICIYTYTFTSFGVRKMR
jgi:hypothetical protein